MHRGEFIKKLATYGIATVGFPSLLSSCASGIYYATASMSGKQIKIAKTEFIFESKGKSTNRKFVLVKNASLEMPICLYDLGDEYAALYTKCTHQGCEVRPQGDYMVCPCHGSEYTNRGKVINPPAEHDLKQFKTTHDETTVYIHLD